MKNYIQDIERALYDVRDADKSIYKSDAGLTEEIIRDISARKKDPPWMLEFRLKSLEVYKKISLPTWGPDISALNMDEIVTYVKPNAAQVSDWSQVPDEIKKTFDRLGIPAAEKKSLAFTLEFRSNERTLTDEEADFAFKNIFAAVEKDFGAILRS